MARSRLYSITSILPRNRSVMARVHGSTRSGCQSLSRNRTIVMVHLLSGFVFDCGLGCDEEARSKGDLSRVREAARRRWAEAVARDGDRLVQARGGELSAHVAVSPADGRHAAAG